MATSHTITIPVSQELAAEVDRTAAGERRSPGELISDVVQAYVERKRRWERIMAMGAVAAQRTGLDDEAAVDRAVDKALDEVRSYQSRP